jgi:hypothetical protein
MYMKLVHPWFFGWSWGCEMLQEALLPAFIVDMRLSQL